MIPGGGWDWKGTLGDFCGGLVAFSFLMCVLADGCVHSGKML